MSNPRLRARMPARMRMDAATQYLTLASPRVASRMAPALEWAEPAALHLARVPQCPRNSLPVRSSPASCARVHKACASRPAVREISLPPVSATASGRASTGNASVLVPAPVGTAALEEAAALARPVALAHRVALAHSTCQRIDSYSGSAMSSSWNPVASIPNPRRTFPRT